MSIACILGGKGERRTKTCACRDQPPISIAMDGNATAEAFITHQWLPDSPKTPAHCGTRRALAGNRSSNEHHSLLARVNAGAVGWLLVTSMHSATVARLNWPARLPQKSLKRSIRQRPRRMALLHGCPRNFCVF